MKKIKLIIIIMSFGGFSVNGQMLIEDIKGNEIFLNNTILYPSQITGSINTKDESFKLNLFVKQNKNLISPVYHSFELKTKAVDGIATIFNNNQFNPGIRFGYTYGKVHVFTDTSNLKKTDFIFIKPKYEVNSYSLFNSDTIFQAQLSEKRFESFGVIFGYSLLINNDNNTAGDHLLSLTFDYKQASNYYNLKKIEIIDELFFADTVSNITRSKQVKSKIVREGDYKTYDKYSLNIAYSRIPSLEEQNINKLKLGYSIYLLNNLYNDKLYTNVGLNLFLTKSVQKGINRGVRNVIGAIIFEIDDIFDVNNKNNSILNRFKIGLSAKYNISLIN